MGATRRHPRFGRLAGALLRTQPDERLVSMARDGSAAAYDEIVRRHRPALTAFAGTVASPSRAEDVVQDSLLKAYAALQEGAEPELLRAWLFRIVRNTAIDEVRGVRHHEQLDESYDGVEQPPQALDRRERIAALIAAIRDLPAAQREAIVKRELEGRGHEEIGRALDVSPGAVRQLIYRARDALREAAGVVIPAAVLRAAFLPGADDAVGGLGMAGALKLGLATVVATGTIVAGTSIERHDETGSAEALQLSPPRDADAPGSAADDSLGGDPRGDDGEHRGSSGGEGRNESGDREHAGGGDDHGGSGDGDRGGSSGPGSGFSGSDSSGPGSGGSDDGGSGSSGPSGGDSLSSASDGGGSGGSDSSGSDDLFSGTSSGPG